MKRLLLVILAVCLLLTACGKKEPEEEAQVGYKPPEVVGSVTQIGEKEDYVGGESASNSNNQQQSGTGAYTGKLPVVTAENQFSVFSINMNGAGRTDKKGYETQLKALMTMLVETKPDVITFQEVGSNWMDQIVPQLKGIYNYYLIYPNDQDKTDANPIFYKIEKFEETEYGGCFWVSDTPDRASPAANGKYYNCTWLQLIEKSTENDVYIFNTRLDAEIAEKGAEVIRSKCESVGWKKSIVCSIDLNAPLASKAGQTLLENLTDSNTNADPTPTVNTAESVQDFSLYSKVSLTPKSYTVLKDRGASDHNPIFSVYDVNTETLNYGDQFIF